MFARHWSSSAILASLLALTTACSSGGGGGGPAAPHVLPPGNFKPASNKKDTVGKDALYANAGKFDRVNSGFFAKKYNRLDLEAVFDASILSTAIYGTMIKAEITAVGLVPGEEKTGSSEVTIAHAAAAPQKPEARGYTYSFLPDASDEQLEFWNQNAGAAGGGTLQGLYYNSGGPKIMILRGADRWTLVHELMHYNFDATRIAQRQDTRGTLDARIKRAARDFDKHMKAYMDLPNRRDLGDAANDLETMMKARIQSNVDSMLEEVTIEAMLIERWSDGRLQNVSDNSPKSGVWYITQSKNTALDDFKDYGPLLDRVEQLANENVWPEIADQVKKNRDLVVGLSARIDEIVAKAKEQTGVDEVPGQAGPELASIAAAYTAMTNPHVMLMANTKENRENRRELRLLVERYK